MELGIFTSLSGGIGKIKALEYYNQLMSLGNGDVFWAATRALTAKWATSLEWLGPVLELGGQNGILAQLMDRHIEIMVDTSPELSGKKPIYGMVLPGNAEKLYMPDEEFGTVVALNMIYHTDRSKVLSECWRVLKKGGILIVTDTPGYMDILTWPFLLRQAGRKDMADIWALKECAVHKVNFVPLEWWKGVPGDSWELLNSVSYCSYTLCLMLRANYTIRNMSSILGIPEVPGISELAMNIALNVDKVLEWVAADEDMCKKEGGVFLFVALRKK